MTNAKHIRVLVADDEALARRRIVRLAHQIPGVVVAAEVSNGDALVSALVDGLFDAILLDVEMPGASVMDAVREHVRGTDTAVVFVTAHERYAVPAFDVDAVDYLLKPIDLDRLTQAFARVRRHRAGQSGTPAAYPSRMLVRDRDGSQLIAVAGVEFFRAARNYVDVCTGDRQFSLRETLTSIERTVDPARFVRIHRSTVVNVDHVHQIKPWFWGDSLIITRRGHKLRLSRRFRAAFHRCLRAPVR